MNINKQKSNNDKSVTLCLPEKFNFQIHAEFRELYETEKESKMLVLDMNKTQYMDSSALGMMLQLKEFADSNKSTVRVKNASNNLLQIFHIVNFDKLFAIEYERECSLESNKILN
jgi:HptB-dependent secretion and biofilm anti anti-sigma factor